MDLQNLISVITRPIAIVSKYVGDGQTTKLKLTEKEIPVKLAGSERVIGKIWDTAEKVGNVLFEVATHPVTKRMMKGVYNQSIDRLEIGAMEKAVDLFGDKILPGEVPAIKIAIMVITGISTVAKN